jgi:hypothetical protein
MTIDEIIKTARNEYGIYAFTAEDLAAFIITIKNAEREECAKVCNDSAYSDANEYDDFSNGCNWCAGAIRARGQQ